MGPVALQKPLLRFAAVVLLLILPAAAYAQCPNNAPQPVSPANNATGVSLQPALQWTNVGVTEYDIYIEPQGFCANPGASSPKGTTNATTFTPGTPLQPNTAYEWRVVPRSGNTFCTAQTMACTRFTTAAAQSCNNPGSFNLVAPADNATLLNTPPLQWQASSGADHYDLYFSAGTSNSNFTKIVSVQGNTTSYSFSQTLPNATYKWYVLAVPACDPSKTTQSRTNTFVISNCPTTAPTLLSPANNATGVASSTSSPVHFSWSAVAGAAHYRLYAAVNGGTAGLVTQTDGTSFDTVAPSGKVEWWIETVTDGCTNRASQHFTFTTLSTSSCPSNPGSPTPVSPADGATNLTSPVTFQWTAVSGATDYRLYAGVDNAALTLVTSTSATSVSAPMPKGTVVWTVEARFGDNCSSTFSKRTTFTVGTGTQCANAAVVLTSPANGSANEKSPVTFKWNKSTGAVSYKLYISVGGAALELAGNTTDTEAQRIVPSGVIAWRVDAVFAGCSDVPSAVFTFVVPDSRNCPTGSIALTAPATGATVISPVTFSWTPISGANSYRVWIAVDGGSPVAAAKTTDTTVTGAMASGSVDWYVEALFSDDCPSIASPHGRFTVQKGTACDKNVAPTIVAPVSGAGVLTSVGTKVDFSWNGVSGAIAYRLWIAAAGQAFADIGYTKDTHLTRELPVGTFSWYVEAIFEGCPALASNRGTFRVESSTPRCGQQAPTLLAPANNSANVGSPVTFLWTAVDTAEDYKIYASLDGGTYLVIGETDATTFTRSLPPGTISWYVEASFHGCSSNPSAPATFTIARGTNCTGELPQLVAPAENESRSSDSIDFAWNPVAGASGYVLFVKVGDGAPTIVGQTLDTHLSRKLPPGQMEWWVIAFVSGCTPAESKHGHFVLTSSCDNKRAILLAPSDDSGELTSPVSMAWTAVPRAKSYRVWAAVGDGELSVIASSPSPQVTTAIPPGTIHWFVEALFDNCPSTYSARGRFRVLAAPPPCGPPSRPNLSLAGQLLSGTSYTVRWSAVVNSNLYELQESATADFSAATTQVISGHSAAFSHEVTKATPFFYRVRAVSACSDDRGPYSEVAAIFIVPPQPTSRQQHVTAEAGSELAVVQTLFLPGSASPATFTAKTNKPWLSVVPPSGTVPPEGIALKVVADPTALILGTNTATVTVTYGGGSAKDAVPNDAPPTTTVPVSVSIVTPVTPGGKNTPGPDSLIIPAVAHAPGANDSLFQSDVRVTNLSAQAAKYQLNFTPTGTDGTQSGSTTSIQIDPGATMALDDILANFFGTGSAAVSGSLEIRPLGSGGSASFTSPVGGVQVTTLASSKTYNVTPNGTFGQYIPAIPFSQFIGKATSGPKALLSLQQIAQSTAYRTNFGLVEASGQPASVTLSVFDNSGVKVGEIFQTLQAGEHRQLNSILAANGITLTDGRIEVEVTSSTGKVTAYASAVDNFTNDPLLVSPVLKSSTSSSRYVLPGVADLNNGVASWRTDMRIFNSSTAPVTVTLLYVPQGNPTATQTATRTLAAGQVLAIDNTLQTLFGLTNSGGSMVVTTAIASNLVVTGRTYNQTSNGTYGQFIPGVTPSESVGNGDRALQVLQLEHSSRYRTNIGVAETSGNGATVEVSLILPDTLTTPKTTMTLAANEFRQFSLADFGLGDIYNARVTVKVTGGSGKVTAYGSVIDQITQDPTYVPAQ
jgi:hypothetical protein